MELGSRKVLEQSDLWDLTGQNKAGCIHTTYDRQLQRSASLKYPYVREPSPYAAAPVSQPHCLKAVRFLPRLRTYIDQRCTHMQLA